VQSYLFERNAGFDAHASRRWMMNRARVLASREGPLNCCRFSIGIAAVVLLVALRVATGWHFFSQGIDHYRDRNWSSEGFLRQAKGPWAEFYRSKVPDFHGFSELLARPWQDPLASQPVGAAGNQKQQAAAAKKPNDDQPAAEAPPKKVEAKNSQQPTEGDPSPEPKTKDAAAKRAEEKLEEDLAIARPVYDDFAQRAIGDWGELRREIAAHYGFDDKQNQQATAVFERYKKGLLNYLASIESDLALYQRELRRLDQMRSFEGSSDVPFASQRLADKQREVANQPNAWLADIRRMERELHEDLAAIATDEQKKRGKYAEPESELKKSDRIIVWAMMICGGCLIVGLFTRIAAVGCAAFLFLVIMSQPPWVPGTITTMFPYQLVEMLALLTLAATAVGRWGGLDFFLHFLITAPFRGRR
jgi:uncharacterized membrane protein YphA (DoxX/SURF4 family)